MKTDPPLQPSFQNHRFSGVMQSWFPDIHHSMFPNELRASVIASAVRRTTHLDR